MRGSKQNVVSARPRFSVLVGDRRRCGNGGKAGAFGAPAFPSSCGNHPEKVAEGHLVGFPQLRPFPERFSPAEFSVKIGSSNEAAPGCRLGPIPVSSTYFL